MAKGADPGKVTSTDHTKRAIGEQLVTLKAAVDQEKAPCGCVDCQDCGECRADITKARLGRQNSLITRLDSRVLALLEKAIAT